MSTLKKIGSQIKGLVLVIFVFVVTETAIGNDAELVKFANTFAHEVKELPLSEFGLDFQENLNNLPKLSDLEQMIVTTNSLSSKFSLIEKSRISKKLFFLYEHIQFELEALKMRLHLEYDFVKKHDPIPSRFFDLKNKNDWYSYYLMKWVSDRVTPEDVFDYGVSEVNRIKGEIEKIKKSLGYNGRDVDFLKFLNDDIFFLKNENDIKARYHQIDLIVRSHLSTLFFQSEIPRLNIERDSNSGETLPPGYYWDNTFYYNFFGEPYNWRAMEWLFIHEAIPGHHYQTTVKLNHPAPEFARVFNWYSGFQEGWAAYTENLGSEIGLYQNVYSQLGKWEWDLVRSVRLVLDVGLNFKGWSQDQARAYWKKNIKGKDRMMEREINRILRWPVQVITYKMGERLIKSLYQNQSTQVDFDIRQFHHNLLQNGPMPLPAVRNLSQFTK